MLPLSRQNAYRELYRRLRPGWRSSLEDFHALVRSHMTASASVLDLGCGRGGAVEACWREARLAVGVDPDRVSLVERREPMPVVCALGEALPFPDATFDLVSALWVLEHLPLPDRVLREVHRVLGPGGHFVFLTPNARHPLVWLNRVNQLFPQLQRQLVEAVYGRAAGDTFRVRYRANSDSRIHALASATGMQVVSLRTVADPTYLAFSDRWFRLSATIERRFPESWGIHLVGDLVRPE